MLHTFFKLSLFWWGLIVTQPKLLSELPPGMCQFSFFFIFLAELIYWLLSYIYIFATLYFFFHHLRYLYRGGVQCVTTCNKPLISDRGASATLVGPSIGAASSGVNGIWAGNKVADQRHFSARDQIRPIIPLLSGLVSHLPH